MLKKKCDYSSRFKILKGGKVSLVVSVLALGSFVNAETLTFSTAGGSTTLTENSTLTIPSGTHNINSGEDITINGNFFNNYVMSIINDGIVNFTDSFYSLYTYNTGDGSSIINNGTINSNNSNGAAYGLYATLKASDIIENNGTITVSGLSGSRSIYVNGSSTASNITNSGTINAYTSNNYDKNAYSVEHNFTASPLSNFSFTNETSGVMNGNIKWLGTFTNSGKISLPYNATNASIGTFINKGTGTLEIGLLTDGTLGNTTYSKLSTTNATFENGSTIAVNVLNTSTNVRLLAGKRLENVVSASTALTIGNTLNITDNSLLLDFNYVTSDGWTNEHAGTIHLNVVQATDENGEEITIERATKEGGGNKNTQVASKVLTNVSNNIVSYPAMAQVITAFNGLQTEAQIAQAVQTTTSSTPTASAGATTQISNGIAGIVTQRQNANMGSGANSGDMMFSEKNFWFKPFGSIGSQNDKNGISGFDVKAQGFGLGLDGEYKDNQNIGFGLFYTSANVDINNVSQEANLDVFTALVYGNIPVIDDKTNFLYQAGYSWQKTDTNRKVFTGETAIADYTSKTASLDLKLMRDVQVSDNLLLQPMIETTYRHFTNPAYKENGAGALNLNVDKFTSSDLIVGLGTLAHYKLTDDSKIVGNVNIGYDLHGKNQTVTSSFEGAAGLKFDTEGIDNGRWSYQAGIGYEKELDKTNSFNISYDYQGQGSDFSNNTVSAKYVLKF